MLIKYSSKTMFNELDYNLLFLLIYSIHLCTINKECYIHRRYLIYDFE